MVNPLKTTVELPDNLYRQIKARAALRGQTLKAFFLEALQEKLGIQPREPEQPTQNEGEEVGWRAVFGKGDKDEIAEVQRIIDENHVIDPEGWDLPGLDSPT